MNSKLRVKASVQEYSEGFDLDEQSGDDAFVDLHPFGQIDRNVVQCGAGHYFHRYAVDEKFNRFSRQTIDRKVEIRAHSAFLTDFHADSPVEFLVQIGVSPGFHG